MPVNPEKFKQRLVEGGFEAVRPIGKGNYATVWECRSIEDAGKPSRTVAAKIIDLSYLRMHKNSKSEIERIKREVTILKGLRHPNIVRLEKTLMVGTDALILVMEYVPGKELFNLIMDKLDAQQIFAESEAAVIFRQLLCAVEYLHNKRIIHRDIKPENIMVRDDWKQRPVDGVKLIDFGLSKQMNHSMAKTFVGTPEYYAPEVNPRDRSGGTYTQAADCWSCGISLYVMLVGQFPGKVASDGVSVYFDPEVMRHISPSAVTLLKQMLATDPAVRINVQQALTSDWLREALPRPPPALEDGASTTSIVSSDSVLPLRPPASKKILSSISTGSSGAVDLDLTKSPGGSGTMDGGSDRPITGGGGAAGRGLSDDDDDDDTQDLGTAIARQQDAIVAMSGPTEKRNKRDDDSDVGANGSAATQNKSPRPSGGSSPTASAYEQRMKQLLLAHRDLAFAAAQACQNANTSIVVQNKCRAAAQTCREELFQAQRVLGNLGQVAKSVLQRQPDLHLGVVEKSTDMCQAFFRDFDKWVEEIKDKAGAMVVSTHKTARSVQDVVATSDTIKAMRAVASTAFGAPSSPSPSSRLEDRPAILQITDQQRPSQKVNVGGGVEVQDVTNSFHPSGSNISLDSISGSDGSSSERGESQEPAATQRAEPDAAHKKPAVNASQFLRESLVGMGDSLAGSTTTAPDSSGGAMQNPQLLQLIDLIFPLVFAQQQQQQQQQQQGKSSGLQSAGVGSSAKSGKNGGAAADDSVAGASLATRHPHSSRDQLVGPSMLQDAKLHQWLFKCDDTLQDIANFWANLENILEHLRHRTGHVEPLITAASKNANIEKLLIQRMGQYFSMWKQILRMCEGMVIEAMQMRDDLYGFLRGGATHTAASTSVGALGV